ncbi:MAG TPA: phosphatidylglycerol lysyltransferase domain-containing protein [bacterium]|nr:phosphatidylglycerol lysyltransferase domain-containing protein [bacterium]
MASAIQLPHADFFDSVQALDADLDRAQGFLFPAPGLNASLPGLLMWQDRFTYALAMEGARTFVLALYGKYVYCPVPPKPFGPESLSAAFSYMEKVNGKGPGISRVEGLTEEQSSQAKTWGYPIRPTLTEYLYDREKLAGLHGDPYRAKRAEINHLLKEEAVLMRPYRAADLKACGDLFEVWKTQRLPALQGQMGEKMILASQKAHLRALVQGMDWGMDGWVVLTGDRLSAYSFGASLGNGTYGVFLEVSDLTVKGLSSYIFSNLCRQVEGHARINSGDAEGLPRLAESKEHWHPAGMAGFFAADPK